MGTFKKQLMGLQQCVVLRNNKNCCYTFETNRMKLKIHRLVFR
jgi:hypothetical protein